MIGLEGGVGSGGKGGEREKKDARLTTRELNERKAGIQCRGMDIRKRRDVDVRNGREMVAGLNRKREDPTSP